MTTPPQPQTQNLPTSHSNHHNHNHHHHLLLQQHQSSNNTSASTSASTTTTTTTATSSATTTATATSARSSRKRPAPGTSAPILSSIPVSSAGLRPSSPTSVTTSSSSLPVSQSMNYLGLQQHQSSSSTTLTSLAGSTQNIYSTLSGNSNNNNNNNNTNTNGSLVDSYRATRSTPDPASSLSLPGTVDANSQIALISRGTNSLVRMPYNSVSSGPSGMGMMGTAGGGGIGLGQVIVPPGQNDGLDPFDRELQMRIDKMRKKRASIPPFVQKLSSFVNDPKTDALIRWSPSGNSFLVLDEDEFSKTLIPDLFKHNNYASFVRQLNMYGFHKVVGLADGSLKTSEQRSKPPSEYENPYFKRGQPDLMWLISKPKGKGRRKTKSKQEDSDNLEEISDGGEDFEGGGGGGGGRGYIEGPKIEGQDGAGHHQQSGGRRPDISALIQQLEAVRNHQAMISAAINRLRKDHNQLYEQSVAFQTLHDRHENSINAILTFLATVYDKSLGGNLNGTISNLFQNQVEHSQALHPQGVGAVVGNVSGAIVTPNRQAQRVSSSQMARRRQQLLLENGPMAGQISEEDSPKAQTSPINNTNGTSMKPVGSPITQNYQTYQSPSIQELGPSLSQDGTRQQQQETQYATRQPQPYANIFSLPDSPIAPAPSPNMNRPSASPVSSHSLTPRLFSRNLVTPGLSSQTLQDHNAQLAQKAREIEELEELQAAQNTNVDELMDMMNKFADTDAEHPGHLHNAGNNPLDGTGSNIDEFLNWGIPGDLGGDGGMSGAFTGVEGDNGLQGGDGLDALFTFHGGDDVGIMGGGIGVDGIGVGQVLGASPSTVVTSPAGSNTSRAREELEEEVEKVQVKRRRIGEDGDELGVDELEKELELLPAAVTPVMELEEDVV